MNPTAHPQTACVPPANPPGSGLPSSQVDGTQSGTIEMGLEHQSYPYKLFNIKLTRNPPATRILHFRLLEFLGIPNFLQLAFGIFVDVTPLIDLGSDVSNSSRGQTFHFMNQQLQ